MFKIAEFRRSRGSSGLGYWCTAVYLTSKFLALINLVVQFHVVNSVVGEGRGDWGLDVGCRRYLQHPHSYFRSSETQ